MVVGTVHYIGVGTVLYLLRHGAAPELGAMLPGVNGCYVSTMMGMRLAATGLPGWSWQPLSANPWSRFAFLDHAPAGRIQARLTLILSARAIDHDRGDTRMASRYGIGMPILTSSWLTTANSRLAPVSRAAGPRVYFRRAALAVSSSIVLQGVVPEGCPAHKRIPCMQ